MVLTHSCYKNIRPQDHELCIDGPDQRHRPFHEPGDLVEQRRIVAQMKPRIGRQFFRALFDPRPALGGVEDHVAIFELFLVVGEIIDLDHRVGEEAVGAGGVGNRDFQFTWFSFRSIVHRYL